jgi:glyoxylase-like metal-dependent hydrolase (beta-lactamase superfamily II)
VTAPELIRVPTPPGPHPSHTNCYVFRDDAGRAFDLVDPGWDDPASLAALEAGLAELGLRLETARTVVATHWHVDHLSMAARIRDRSGARVLLGRGDEADAGIPIDGLLADGDALRLGVTDVMIAATPGHTPGSICIGLPDDDLLLTGDTVLPAINPGVGLGHHVTGNPIRDYLETLRRLELAFDDRAALPGHGPRIDDLPARCRELAAHHRARTEQVAAVLAGHPGATPEEIAPHLTWTGGWDSLDDLSRMSAVRQTGWHLELAAAGAAPS